MSSNITTIFTDIGGVLLTNGWDHNARELAIKKFDLDTKELNSRHSLAFDTFEAGKMSLDEYLDYIVFYQPRSFSKNDFINFMYSYSQPDNEMLDLLNILKSKYNLKIYVVSNEGRELNEYRIKTFELYKFVDCFVSSSFVHLRKPDQEIFKLALDLCQTPVEEIVYLEDRPVFVDVAAKLGIKGIVHNNYKETKAALEEMGLKS